MKKILMLVVVLMAALSSYAQEMYLGRWYQSLERL